MNKIHTTALLIAAIALPGALGAAQDEKIQTASRKGSDAPASPAPTVSIPAAINRELILAKELFENRDGVKAFEIFAKYAAKGDPEATAWLGRCYLKGIGTISNFERAYSFFSQAAAKNNPWGLNGAGVCHLYGVGTVKNLHAAMAFFKKAAEKGHPLATLNLARIYADKDGGFFDVRQAEVFFRRALELNARDAKATFAEFLYNQKRYQEAIPLFLESLDNSISMQLLAMCYQNGFGVPLNVAEAVKLAERHFRKFGAAKWSADLCFEAGLEEIVINKTKITEQARRRLKCAADQGHAEAQYVYALILAETDKDGAFVYMLKSADQDYPDALIDAGKALVEREEYKQAIKYFMIALGEKKTERMAAKCLSEVYHYKLKMPKSGMFIDIRGAELGSDFCRNELAKNELLLNSDEHFAKAAALFAEGVISDNSFSKKMFDLMLQRDYERLRILADKNNSDALLALGIVGCMERPGHPNIPIGLELLERSAMRHNAAACRILGRAFTNGVIVPKDLKKALEWHQKGAEYGDAESARSVALMLFYEPVFKNTSLKDYKKAFDRALELEAFDIAFEYGRVMESLGGDLKKAEELYRLGARHGDPRAMIRLHDILFKRNLDESIAFLIQAVESHYSEAELRMGYINRMYESPRKAFTFYLKAYYHGDRVSAPYQLAECWLNGYGCETNLTCFWQFADEAYKNGSAEVCYLLGSVYRDGKICARDLAKAKAYFEEGAKRGNEDCKKALRVL